MPFANDRELYLFLHEFIETLGAPRYKLVSDVSPEEKPKYDELVRRGLLDIEATNKPWRDENGNMYDQPAYVVTKEGHQFVEDNI